ncbi:MAG TPA: hypothetical protein DIU07_08005, partial [Rhodobacteraceae bacterium]|nr:hypothetical protein [Paracoccaceae bacterium]
MDAPVLLVDGLLAGGRAHAYPWRTMKCPVCATEMDVHARHGVNIDHCPACGGVWLGKGELDHLMAAVRPAVPLRNPDPNPVRPAPKPRPEPSRTTRSPPPSTPRNPSKPERYEHRGREARESAG